jgi:MoxR-like ATPase
MNDDASTFELPEYIHSRLQPQILIDFPERDEEYQILKENLPFAEERILTYVTDFLQQAHAPTSATRCATASTSAASPSS